MPLYNGAGLNLERSQRPQGTLEMWLGTLGSGQHTERAQARSVLLGARDAGITARDASSKAGLSPGFVLFCVLIQCSQGRFVHLEAVPTGFSMI